MTLTIGLVGVKYAGKSTVANLMGTFKEFTFAGPLKDGISGVFPTMDHGALYDTQRKETVETTGVCGETTTYRTIMTDFGDAVREKFGQGIFINVLRHRLQREQQADKIVISDVRSVAEADFVNDELDGLLIRIVRDGSGCETRVVSGEIKQEVENDVINGGEHHTETEQACITCHATIINNGSVAQLASAISIAIQTARDVKRGTRKKRLRRF
jgi:hypothetical protein